MNVEMVKDVPTSQSGSDNDFLKWFAISAAIILTVTGVAKLWSAAGNAKLLGVPDPIFGFRFRYLMFTVGVLGLVIAGVCLFGKSSKVATMLTAWLATCFMIYRLGLWWTGWKLPCGCLGSLADAIKISPQLADNVTKVILTYLLIGSYVLLLYQWNKSRRTGSASIQ